jgi:hypothetical protein
MFPQTFAEREQKNACNPLTSNENFQPVPVVPDVPANAHIQGSKFDGLTASILTAVGASPAGMIRDDLERLVARSHPTAGALIRASVDRLLLAGDITRINGRIKSSKAVRS